MANITFKLPIFNSLTKGLLSTNEQFVTVDIELTEGEHTFISEPVEVGEYYHYKVFAQLSIPYSYDPETQFVTIAGKDDGSDKQVSILTSLEQHPHITDARVLNTFATTQGTPNLLTSFIESTPEVKLVIQKSVRYAIDALVQQLLDAGVQGVIQTGPAPVVTPENYLDYKAMFAPDKPDTLQPSLTDITEVQSIVFSTYGGTITWSLNYSFANVIGSTNDPKPYGYSSWIQLWADKCNSGGYPTLCSSYNYANGKSGFSCSSSFVGGHVIPGTTAKYMPNGSTVYIFPICVPHNNNDNIYMSMRYNPVGVVLKNYNL
ncbi:MAG: hypothetical protein K1X91_10200 [Bacteriodetes bacterium]|nr:hypothetical protein [Bacteroidota bacterium]